MIQGLIKREIMFLQTKYDMIIYDIKIELMEALFKQNRNAIKNYSVNILYIFQFQTTNYDLLKFKLYSTKIHS